MKSKETIEIEFAKAIRQAQELEDVAAALSVVANSVVDKEVGNIAKVWKGNNASLFAMKTQSLSTDIFEAAQNLINVAKSIRSTANLVYEAEKAALYIAYH